MMLASAAVLLAAGCVHLPARSDAQIKADAATAARVYTVLKSSPRYFYPALEVRVDDGVAYLTGLAFDGPDRDAATWLARGVTGVRGVTNAIEVVAGR
jgi:osmotically-inducible protein OsmY